MTGSIDLLFCANGEKRVWFTARDLAALALPGLPQTERGINQHGRSWRETSLARKRSGRGGGWEYHLDILSETTRKALAKRQDMLLLEQQSHSVRKSAPKVPASTTAGSAAMTARQRLVAEARAFICLEVERRAILNETSERKAIVDLVEEVNRALALPADLRTCAPELLAQAAIANDRRKGLSRSTVSGWLAARRQGGVGALAARPRKPWSLTANNYPWAPGFLSFYATPQKRTAAHALDLYAKSLDDPRRAPSYDQVKRYLTRLKKADPIAAHRGREGVLALKARKVYVSRSTESLLPTDVYTADGKTFDAFVAHPFSGLPFRPEITSILDVATRKCVGYSIGLNEKAYDVAEALRNASIHCGVAAIFYVDNGKGYKNLTLDDAAVGMLARLGTHKEHSLPYNSQARGIIERFNGTALNRLAKELPSYCGKDLDRNAALSLHKQIKHDLKETGGSRHLPSWESFLADLDAVLAEYNGRPHSSLPAVWDPVQKRRRPTSPEEAWAQAVQNGVAAITLDQTEADDLARPAVRRRVSRGLVTIETNRYYAIELEPYDRRDVMVCYDALDASKVWVRELDHVEGRETPGRLVAVAAFEGNKQSYFPQSVIESAREKKATAAAKRLKDKLVRVEMERRPGLLLEADGETPMEMFASSPGTGAPANDSAELIPLIIESEHSGHHVEAMPPRPSSGQRRIFATDEDLAAFALDHPDELTASQKKVLRGCLTRKTDLDLFRLSGIDVERLRTVLRAAA